MSKPVDSSAASPLSGASARKKVLFFTMEAPRMPGSGGQVRSWFFAKALSEISDVAVVSLGGSGGGGVASDGLREWVMDLIECDALLATGGPVGRVKSWMRSLKAVFLPWHDKFGPFLAHVMQYVSTGLPEGRRDWPLMRRGLAVVIGIEHQLISKWFKVPPSTTFLFMSNFERVLATLKVRRDFGPFDVIWFEHTLLYPFAVELKRIFPQAALCCNAHNVEWILHTRMAAAALDQSMKRHEIIQARLLKSMESECFSACDLVVACSEQDRDGVLALSPMTVCEVIGNGVDTNYFQRPHSAVRATLPTVLFTGSFGYGPNAEAVLWFAKEVLPLIHREVDNCHFVVAGSRAFALRNAPELLDSRIQLVSDPDDMRPSFHRAWVVAVPLLVGGGTRLKILESMAMECPVVSTALGAEGIPLVNDRDAFIRDEPKAFAEGVIRLLRNEPLRQRISATALKFVQDHYDWKALTSGLGDVLDTLPGGHG